MSQSQNRLSRRKAGPVALGLGLIGLLGACAPALDTSRPVFAFGPRWHSAAPGTPRLMNNLVWWQDFRDPILNALIGRALTSNPDLAAAQARAKAAGQLAGTVAGPVNVTGGLGLKAKSGRLATEDSTQSADLGIEILFDPGRGREASRSLAAASAGEAAAQAAGARLFLLSEVSDAYLALRYDQRRLALAQADSARQRQTLALARKLEKGGETTKIETLRSQARIASLEAEMPSLEGAVASDVAKLALLAGDAPGALPADLASGLMKNTGQPRARMAPDPGIPADLIRNRPDIRAAEARYDAARAALGQARAALYPSLSLSGTIEAARNTRGAATSTGSLLSLGPNLRLPALPQGPARASISAADSRVEAAHADWTSAVLKALYEVETALIDYRAAVRSEAAADRAVNLHAQARRLMRDATSAGEATLSDLISVEDALASAETVQATAQLNRARSFALLNIRLGAGADPAPSP